LKRWREKREKQRTSFYLGVHNNSSLDRRPSKTTLGSVDAGSCAEEEPQEEEGQANGAEMIGSSSINAIEALLMHEHRVVPSLGLRTEHFLHAVYVP